MIELIVADDGSDVEHRERYREMNGIVPATTFLLPAEGETGRYGPSENRNRGIRAARGEFIAFLDDDDYWIDDEHLESAADALEQQKADFLFASWRTEDAGKVRVPDWYADCAVDFGQSGTGIVEVPHQVFFVAWVKAFVATSNVCVIRRSLLDSIDGYYRPIHYAEDHHLVARVADRAQRILYRRSVVASIDVTPRPRAFTAYSDADKQLQVAMGAQHLYINTKRQVLQKSARGAESWAYVQISQSLESLGNPAAVEYAWRALRARVGKSSLEAVARTGWRALRGGFGKR